MKGEYNAIVLIFNKLNKTFTVKLLKENSIRIYGT